MRDELRSRLRLVCSAYKEQVLLQDRNGEWNGRQCLAFFESVASELAPLAPEGGKVAICARDSRLLAMLVLATLYSRRVPVIFGVGKHEDVHEVHAGIGISAILEEAELDWHASPFAASLCFSLNGELVSRRPGVRWSTALPALDECGLILFTSGTMGNQKAVNVPLRGMLETYKWLANRFSLTAKDVATITLPLSHTFAFNTHFMPAFMSGTKSVFLNHPSLLGRHYELIGKHRGRAVAVVGEMLRLFKRERDLRDLPLCHEVRHVQIAGGKITTEHLLDAQALFPNAIIHKGYGMTETIRTSMIGSNEPGFMSETCGFPLPGQEVRVRDENGNDVAAGEPGQLFVRSHSTLLAYDGHPRGSALRPDGFFATGDWGSIDADGRLTCIDRSDRIFKIAGQKVSAVELERVVTDFNQVESAKCAPIDDKRKGARPVMFIELASNVANVADGFRFLDFESSLRENLDPAKVPRDVVIMSKLPRTANDKVKVDILQKLWEKKNQLIELSIGAGIIRFHQWLEPAEKGLGG